MEKAYTFASDDPMTACRPSSDTPPAPPLSLCSHRDAKAIGPAVLRLMSVEMTFAVKPGRKATPPCISHTLFFVTRYLPHHLSLVCLQPGMDWSLRIQPTWLSDAGKPR